MNADKLEGITYAHLESTLDLLYALSRVLRIFWWILFSLTGLLAGIIGLRSKIKGIRNMGYIIFTSGIVGDLFYILMSVPDSMYIN